MAHKKVADMWKKPKEGLGDIAKQRLVVWRRERVVTKIDKPTRIDRARKLGYKAKQGFVIARTKVKRGARKTPKPAGGRRPKRSGRFHPLGKSWQAVAEEKTARKFPNLEVLNSYWVGQDGKSKWFEVILVDPNHPVIKKDRNMKWITTPAQKKRAFRGLTSSGKKSRGLRKK